MRCEGHRRLRGGEQEAELLGDEVASQWEADDAFLEDQAVVDRGYGDIGGSDVYDKRCRLPGGETCYMV